MKDDYTTNSHYLTYTFLFKRVGRMYILNLGVKGLIYHYNYISFFVIIFAGGFGV